MADTTVNGVKVPFLPVGGVDGLKQKPPIQLPGEKSFDAILQKELDVVKFSKHAQERLQERHISLNQTDMSDLQNAIARAEKKGSQDSLVLLRDMAFIVSVKNKTVVTAMQGETMKENVFTNIDSAVIAG
ncbi:MAG: flagellar protein [Ignavibacteriae bacterium]|nr:flagellar protein [Ignavibacteriota bacterium]